MSRRRCPRLAAPFATALLAAAPAAQKTLLDFPNELKPESAQGIYVADDLDGDGDLDLVVAPHPYRQPDLLLLENDGSGGLQEVKGGFPPVPADDLYGLGTTFDAEGDGDVDIVFARVPRAPRSSSPRAHPCLDRGGAPARPSYTELSNSIPTIE